MPSIVTPDGRRIPLPDNFTQADVDALLAQEGVGGGNPTAFLHGPLPGVPEDVLASLSSRQ